MVEIIELDIPLTDEQLIEDYLDFMERTHDEFFKLKEPLPRSANRHFLITKSTTHRFINYLAQEDGIYVAEGTIRSNIINKERSHICYFTIHVVPTHRQQGIAKKILAQIINKAGDLGITTYRCRIEEVIGYNESDMVWLGQWFNQHGGKLSDTLLLSRVYASALDVSRLRQQQKHLSQKLPMIELQLVTKQEYHDQLLADDEYATQVIDFYNEAARLVPRGTSTRGAVQDTIATAREKARNVQGDGWDNLTYLAWDSKTKQYVGSSQVYYSIKEQFSQVFTGLTAVRKAFWGRGIATYMKISMLLHLYQLGFEYLGTANDQHNDGMLAINHKLGFREVARLHHFEGEFKDLFHELV